ncbi:MAG: polysaccharide biosynthesis protein, partial [Clostridiales bacterium]|nr:polysaccharide biosynthesis protein [Clostridiales bacterium]
RTFVVPAIVSMIMAAAAYLAYRGCRMLMGNTVSTFIAVFVGVLIYGIGMVSFHGITQEELAALPKGNTIIRFLRKLGLLR